MRYLLPFVLTALFFAAACSGSSAPLSTTDPPGNQQALAPTGGSLGDIPAPREVSTGDSTIDISGTTRSFLLTSAVYLPPSDTGVHFDSVDFNLVFDPSTDEQISYTIFPLFGTIDDTKDISLGQVNLDMNWHGDTPTAEHGFYIGIPDYVHNTWVWRGPAHSASDIMDFSSEHLTGNPKEFAFDKMAIVNYSSVEVKLRFIGLTTINPNDTNGDESLLFITNDGGSYAINSTSTSDLDTSAVILQENPGVELANVQVLDTPGGPLLVFDRRADGGNWEVWQADLDGSNPQVRYSGAGDVRFSVATPDDSYEFTVQDGGPDMYSSLVGHMPGNNVAAMTYDLPGQMAGGNSWYYGANMPNVGVVGTGLDENGQQSVMMYSWSEYLQQGFFYPMVNIADGATAYDPFYFNWSDGMVFSPRITLYSESTLGDDTNDIHSYFMGLTTELNNEAFLSDDNYSLRYPSVSPDHRLLSVVGCQPGMDYGELFVQSSFLRTLDETAGIAANVVGTPAWYDPTPPVFETN